MISWWNTNFSEDQAMAVYGAIKDRNLSQGKVTSQLEKIIAKTFKVKDCICLSSGTSALMVSMIAAGVRPGSEVIVPNRTWISTAHAARILGAEVIVARTYEDSPIMDVSDAINQFSERTVAVVPVFMNGRQVPEYKMLVDAAKKRGIAVIDDAAQAIGALDSSGIQLGAVGSYGCFSLSVAKLVGSGQGGFILTNSDEVAKKLRSIRTHGVESTNEPDMWNYLGGNFRYNDMAASLVFEQLEELPMRVARVRGIFNKYVEEFKKISLIQPISVNIVSGETPVYCEFFVKNREQLQKYLKSHEVETRKFYPDISKANYIAASVREIEGSRFQYEGIYLPSGPGLKEEEQERVIELIKAFYAN